MLTGGGLLDCRSLAEEVPMNKELMCDENFIRCSTMIAELLMKYKNKEYEESEESKADSSPYFFTLMGLISAVSSFIIVTHRCLLLTKWIFAVWLSNLEGGPYNG